MTKKLNITAELLHELADVMTNKVFRESYTEVYQIVEKMGLIRWQSGRYCTFVRAKSVEEIEVMLQEQMNPRVTLAPYVTQRPDQIPHTLAQPSLAIDVPTKTTDSTEIKSFSNWDDFEKSVIAEEEKD